MPKFKHGQRVSCVIEYYGSKRIITDAKISIDKYGTPFICQNRCSGNSTQDKLGYRFAWQLRKDFTEAHLTKLKAVPNISIFEEEATSSLDF